MKLYGHQQAQDDPPVSSRRTAGTNGAVAVLRPRPATNGHGPDRTETRDDRAPASARATPDSRALERPTLLATLALGLFWVLESTNYDRPQWYVATPFLAGAVIAFAVVRGLRGAAWLTLGHALVVGVVDRVVRVAATNSDVMAATQEAIGVLANGGNPYAHTFVTVNSPPPSQFPYLPGEIAYYSIPNVILGHVAGADRWSAIGVLLILATLAVFVGPARAALATALYGTFGYAAALSLDGSNDTGLAFLLLLAVLLLLWSERTDHRSRSLFYGSAVLFAWTLLFKQFAWLFYPFVVLHLRRRGADWRGHAAVSLGLLVFVSLPFFLTAPVGFLSNVSRWGAHREVWGLNLWSALQTLSPGAVAAIAPVLPIVDYAAVAVVGLAMLARPASSLGLALLQGTGLLFVALFLGNWTTSPYYTFGGAIFAAGIALTPLPLPAATPQGLANGHRPFGFTARTVGFPWRFRPLRPTAWLAWPRRYRMSPAVPSAAALLGAALAALLLWTSGWFAADPFAGGPLQVTTPDVTFGNGRLTVATSLTMRDGADVRGWFFLSKPGEVTPWQTYSYKSPVVETTVTAGQPAVFHWSAPTTLPRGTYQPTFWFHKRAADDWVHMVGGDFGALPIAVDPEQGVATRSFLLAPRSELPRLRAGVTNPLDLDVTQAARTGCRAWWQLIRPSDDESVALGTADGCERLDVDLPESVVAGTYTLKITAIGVGAREGQGRDQLVLPVVVTE